MTSSRTTGVGSYMIALVSLQLAGSRPSSLSQFLRTMSEKPFSKSAVALQLYLIKEDRVAASQSGAIKLQRDGLMVTAVYSPAKTNCTENKLSYRSQSGSSLTFFIFLCVYVLFFCFSPAH